MKKDIHPNWHNDCSVTCACGATFTTGSIYESLTVEICSQCHPFFTGEMKFVDTQGRVDKFMKKRAQSEAKRAALAKEKASKKKEAPAPKDNKSYRQILAATKSNLNQKPDSKLDKPAA